MKNQMLFLSFLCSILLWCSAASIFTFPRGDANQTSELLFLTNATRNSISILNNTLHTAGVWDGNSNLSSIFNGANGSAIIYNSAYDSGVYIPGNASNSTWNSSTEHWPSYFQNLNLTHHYLNSGRLNGTVFNRLNATTEIMNEVSNGLSGWTSQFTENPSAQSNSWNYFTNSSNAILNLFNNPVSGLLTLMSDRTFILGYDYFWMTEFLQGLSKFFNSIRGGIPFLLNREFLFNPIYAFNARNGIDAFTALLQALQSRFELTELIDMELNQPENFLGLLNQLGGNRCRRVNGRLRRVYERLTSRNQSCFNTEDPNSVNREWNESLKSLNSATRALGPRFEGLRRFVRQMRGNSEREF